MGPTRLPETDVLIIVAGPPGLVLSLWLSRLGVNTRILTPDRSFQARTLEILDGFGLGERVWKEASHLLGKTSGASPFAPTYPAPNLAKDDDAGAMMQELSGGDRAKYAIGRDGAHS
ncbi:hypothetical protein F4779DRAFT_622594 [Xylariaceae sp. FL0662B]|nr:hypothetical protein F4779DRAFT_622594 [Xylariaceae sp. FL0662B]